MERYFVMVLETSVLCGGVIFLIGLVSLMTKKSHSPYWRYFLWIMLSIRLLLPFDISLPVPALIIPVSESFAPAWHQKPEGQKIEGNAGNIKSQQLTGNYGNTQSQQMPGADTKTGSQQITENGQAAGSQQMSGNEQIAGALPAGRNPQHTASLGEEFLKWSSYLWAFGALLLSLWQIAVYISFQRKVKKNRVFLMEKDGLLVYTSSYVKAPVLLGLLKPQILLPPREYQEQELFFILRHEKAHHQRKDLAVKLLLAGARTLHWFNPAVCLMTRWACRDIELLCDSQAVSGFTLEEKKSYSEMLLSYAAGRGSQRSGRGLLCSSEFSEGSRTLKERFFNIFAGGGRKKGRVLAASGGMVILFISLFVVFGQRDSQPPVSPSERAETQQPKAPDVKTIDSLPALSLEAAATAAYGEQEPELLYVSSQRAVLYNSWGLLVYDLQHQKIEALLDLPAVDLLPGEVSADGNQLLLYHKENKTQRYCYYIDDKRLEVSDLTAFTGNHYDGLAYREERGYVLDEYGRTACLTTDSLMTEEKVAFHPENMQSLSLVVSDRSMGSARVYPLFQDYYEEKGEIALSRLFRRDVNREVVSEELLYEDEEGWRYYLEQDKRFESPISARSNNLTVLLLVRYRENERQVLEDLLVDSFTAETPVIFTEGGRIVYAAARDDKRVDVKSPALVSIALDGSDRRVADIPYDTFQNVCEDQGYIYYTGWTQDGSFPRPLCRLPEDFSTQTVKVDELPGMLCGVSEGYVFYMADDTKKSGIWQKNLSTGKEQIYDKAAWSASELSYFNARELMLETGEGRKPGSHIIYGVLEGDTMVFYTSNVFMDTTADF